MRVLMLSWEFPPRIIGGISTHVYHLSKALARRGAAVHVITCDFPNAKPEEVIDGVRVSRVDCSRVSQKDLLLWTYYMNSLMIEQGTEVLRRDSFDLIHAHDWMVGRVALELKSRLSIPLVTTIHATEIGRGGGAHSSYQKTIHGIEELLIHHSERIICCSKYMLRHVHNIFDLSPEKTDLVPNAVDAVQFDRVPTPPETAVKPQLGENAPRWKVILYVGRIVREKGLYTLVDAFDRLRQKRFNANLVIVGEGPLKGDLVTEIHSRGLDRYVHFTGSIDEAKLVDLYKSSDAFVLPSLYEPFGIAALEAMASGVPVVVTDTGGLSEIVENGVTGLKVPADDPDSLAIALHRVLNEPSLAEHLKQNAYRLISESYNWDLVAQKTLQVYGRALVETRRSAALRDEDFLTESGLLYLLFTLGATKRERAKTAAEIAASIKASEVSVKLILGRLASQAYVSNLFEPELAVGVGYHLTESGIIKACAGFS